MYNIKQEDCYFLYSKPQHCKFSLNSLKNDCLVSWPYEFLSYVANPSKMPKWQANYFVRIFNWNFALLWFAIKKEATFLLYVILYQVLISYYKSCCNLIISSFLVPFCFYWPHHIFKPKVFLFTRYHIFAINSRKGIKWQASFLWDL